MSIHNPTTRVVAAPEHCNSQPAPLVLVTFTVILLFVATAMSQELCTITGYNGTPGSVHAAASPGDQIAAFIDPVCCGIDAQHGEYPHRIESVSFSFTGEDVLWPIEVDIIVFYRALDAPHPCAGPGPELHRETVLCEQAAWEFPNIGTHILSGIDCLTGPVFVSIEIGEDNPEPIPHLICDDGSSPARCDSWYFTSTDDSWLSWPREFAVPLPGNPLISVAVTQRDSSCETPTFLYGDADGSGSWSLGDPTYMQNWWFGGGPAPDNGADLNNDCQINRADWEIMMSMIFCPPPPCYPSGYTHSCSEPYVYRCLVYVGDSNGDQQYSVGDAVHIINFIFGGGPEPVPFSVASADANGDLQVSISDAVFLINYIFGSGEAPPGCSDDWPYQCGG